MEGKIPGIECYFRFSHEPSNPRILGPYFKQEQYNEKFMDA